MHISEKIKKALEQAVVAFAGTLVVSPVEISGGSTWNDGGSWYRGVFVAPSGQYYIATMETDYTGKITVTPARRVETIKVDYEPY